MWNSSASAALQLSLPAMVLTKSGGTPCAAPSRLRSTPARSDSRCASTLSRGVGTYRPAGVQVDTSAIQARPEARSAAKNTARSAVSAGAGASMPSKRASLACSSMDAKSPLPHAVLKS